MKPSTLQQKASRLLALDQRRKAHHAALSSLHASPLPSQEEHEARGLKMWRRLRTLEQLAHRGAVAYCNGETVTVHHKTASKTFDFRADENAWEFFRRYIESSIRPIFGGIAPPGFYVNGDARGMALCINAEKVTIPQGMQTNWGGDGILAAEITL